jgi:hypothetical protein
MTQISWDDLIVLMRRTVTAGAGIEGKRFIWIKWGYNITLLDKFSCSAYRIQWDVWRGRTVAIYQIISPKTEWEWHEWLFGSNWHLEKEKKVSEEERRKISAALKEDLEIDLEALLFSE